MTEARDLPAGGFSSWLRCTRVALIEGDQADVPCGECCACCKTSHFVHIGPDETETLARIPRELLFPAPGLPAGNVLLGYDEQGLCCYYRHQFMLTREVLDDEDNFYSERAHFERVHSWRLKGSNWLRYSETGGTAGSCSDHGLKTKYEITPCRPG